MARYDAVDLKLTLDGDLFVDRGDIALASGNDFIAQQAANRLGGSNPGWFYDAICADVEAFLGAPNTEVTANKCIQQMIISLTKDGLINSEDIYIKATPTSPRSVLFFVFINSPFSTTPLGFEINLHLANGISLRRM